MPRLDLVPIYLPEHHDLIGHLRAALASGLKADVRLRTAWFDPERSFDAGRAQYSSTMLLRLLLDDPLHTEHRVLAVASVDLFAPVLTYVFGEAQLAGRAAVVSLHRLRAELYGLPADAALLAGRLVKEAIHEVGHTYGLVHCAEASCVMRSSTYVEDIDLKPATFCDSCLQVVRRDWEPCGLGPAQK